jgi:hypothetical protein
MRRLAVLCAVGLGIAADVNADGGCPTCSHQPFTTHQPFCGHQPWYNMILARDKCRGRDQARLQQFWHDYYRTLSAYYGMIEHMDWVSYYKHHGTPIGQVQGCGGSSSMQMAPMYVVPGIPYGYTHNLRAPWSPPHVPWGPGYNSTGHCSECSP